MLGGLSQFLTMKASHLFTLYTFLHILQLGKTFFTPLYPPVCQINVKWENITFISNFKCRDFELLAKLFLQQF